MKVEDSPIVKKLMAAARRDQKNDSIEVARDQIDRVNRAVKLSGSVDDTAKDLKITLIRESIDGLNDIVFHLERHIKELNAEGNDSRRLKVSISDDGSCKIDG